MEDPMIRALRALILALTVSLAMASAVQAKAGGAPSVPLTTGQESSQVTSAGSGSFSYTVNGNELCYVLDVRNMTGVPTAAHIHIGPRNVAGPVVVPLAAPLAATSTVSDCIVASESGAMTPAELAAIVADPGSYYVNVHTVAYPGGEVRGQLK
jgi:hypothetical protein